ncbi:MAG TPA: UDP-N-acetylglucosamine 2-epimerase (non-hydrolyzing) [Actinomycetota bacterium]|nr:UDP-N-acetylglucosamine 2-epimerase (non-hydrolyzing) [Actinomycetota bacterium]
MRAAVIAGARPNFVKVAPLMPALRDCGVEPLLVHTGQHYDHAMSGAFFDDLKMAPPDINLGVGSGSHAEQTAAVMVAFEDWLAATPVDAVVTVGDVNSAMACALVAAKLGVPVAHVEAGLRSYDRAMPEEINRIVVDALSSWLFTPSRDGDANLVAEGVPYDRIHFVGNVMVDSLLQNLERAMASTVLDQIGVRGQYGLVTLHRAGLVDDPLRLRTILLTLGDIAADIPLVFPVHPRTRAQLHGLGLPEAGRAITLTDPKGYLDFIRLEAGASIVLTDSGGIQEETTVLGVPCITLRENTERPITITRGTNRLVGLRRANIRAAAQKALQDAPTPRRPPLWDGHTAERIATIMARGPAAVDWSAGRLGAWASGSLAGAGSPGGSGAVGAGEVS